MHYVNPFIHSFIHSLVVMWKEWVLRATFVQDKAGTTVHSQTLHNCRVKTSLKATAAAVTCWMLWVVWFSLVLNSRWWSKHACWRMYSEENASIVSGWSVPTKTSPYLNRLNYLVWDILQQHLHELEKATRQKSNDIEEITKKKGTLRPAAVTKQHGEQFSTLSVEKS